MFAAQPSVVDEPINGAVGVGPGICPGHEPNAPLSIRARICRWNSTSQNAPRWAVILGSEGDRKGKSDRRKQQGGAVVL
jgi:hypothetical protein